MKIFISRRTIVFVSAEKKAFSWPSNVLLFGFYTSPPICRPTPFRSAPRIPLLDTPLDKDNLIGQITVPILGSYVLQVIDPFACAPMILRLQNTMKLGGFITCHMRTIAQDSTTNWKYFF